MSELITLFTLGIALSMDTFSLSLGLGMCQVSLKNVILLSVSVACFHFIMPLIGTEIGMEIFYHLNINYNLIIGSVLILLSLSMIKDLIKNNALSCKNSISTLGIIIFSISVSFDSLVTGMGLLAVTNKVLLAAIIISLLSFVFTLLGLILGKYAQNKIGIYSNTLGIALLLFLGITYLCK